jgi:hypothetical protein
MRSDILGFNAPIEQNKGLYFYSDPGYSILSISISDSGLAMQIIKLLSELKSTVNHPELETILMKLMNMTGRSGVTEEARVSKKSYKESATYDSCMPAPSKAREVESDMKSDVSFSILHSDSVVWGDVMEMISLAVNRV